MYVDTKTMGNKIGVRIVKAEKTQNTSTQLDDPFADMYETEGLLDPPYPPLDFAKIPEMNNVLQPLVDAYKTNITGFGYGLKYKVDMESPEIDQGIKDRAKKEWVLLDLFYRYCNFDKSFTELTKLMVEDREKIGWGVLEVIPKANGQPGGIEHIPAHTIRMSKPHKDIQQIPVAVVGADGKQIKITFAKRFRKFCQIREDDSTKKVWFKEFGDPRKMDYRTGQYEVEYDDQGNESRITIEPQYEANSVIFFRIPASYTPYGIPRWIGNILSITGSRKSEELNYQYFIKGRHIPMAILVKNGSLTESSIDKLKEYSNNLNGVENAFGYLVLEAEGFDPSEGFDEAKQAQVDIKLQPLSQVIQQDGLFQTYDSNCRDKTRASFRLPPIYTGESKDYTRATADTARSIAEEQIFNPERIEIADKFNRLVNSSMDIRYVDMYFQGPNLSNKLELAQAIDIYRKAGVLTPNMLIAAVSELLGQEFEQITEEWGNLPIDLTIEQLRAGVKVKATGNDTSTNPTYTDDSTGGEDNE